MRKKTKSVLFKLTIAIASTLLTLLILEGVVRLYFTINPAYRPRLAEEVIPAGTMRPEKTLGWETVPNQTYQIETTDACDNPYIIEYTASRDGFRFYPETTKGNKPRILIIGDSFTMAAEVSNDDTYYAHIAKTLDADTYVIGTGGFGTLQEYMLLDRYLDDIHPDLVLWQFCTNDFINNSFELELRAPQNNNGIRRPYLKPDGKIVYAIPRNFPALRSFANNYSKLLYLILLRLDRANTAEGDIEVEIEVTGKTHPLLLESRDTTATVFHKIQDRLAGTPLYVFCVDDKEPYFTVACEMFERQEIPFISGIADSVKAVEVTGTCVRAADGFHWNPTGHAIVGEALADYLSTHLPETHSSQP